MALQIHCSKFKMEFCFQSINLSEECNIIMSNIKTLTSSLEPPLSIHGLEAFRSPGSIRVKLSATQAYFCSYAYYRRLHKMYNNFRIMTNYVSLVPTRTLHILNVLEMAFHLEMTQCDTMHFLQTF